MIFLVAQVPVYLVLAARARGTATHAPMLEIDRLIPLVPTWALVYGALYAFLILLPVLVVQDPAMINRTVWAYLSVWMTSYVVFFFYPTFAPRPDIVTGDGFAVWGLRFLYDSDPPFNCFPSLHVAHSLVSGAACYRVHRSLGLVALGAGSLVGLSTLFTRQHYVIDVLAGAFLAGLAYAIFLHGAPRHLVSFESRVAPGLALCAAGLVGAGLAASWVAYQLGLKP